MHPNMLAAFTLVAFASAVAGAVTAKCWNRVRPTWALALTSGLCVVILCLVLLLQPETVERTAAGQSEPTGPGIETSGVHVLPPPVIRNYDRELADTLRPTVFGNALYDVRQLLYAPKVLVLEHVVVKEDPKSYLILCGRANALGSDNVFLGSRRFVLAPGQNVAEAETGVEAADRRTAAAWARFCGSLTADSLKRDHDGG